MYKNKRILIRFLLIMIAIFLSSLSSIGISATEDNTSSTELSNLPPGKEIVEARTKYSKVIRDNQKGDALYISMVPLHYRDDKGKWQDIKTEVESSVTETDEDGKAFGFRSVKNTFQSYLPKNSQGWVQLRSGQYRLSFRLATQLANIDWKINNNKKDGIYAGEILNKCDLKLAVKSGGLKEEIILKDRTAPREFQYQIRTQDLTASKTATGEIVFKNDKNIPVFYIPKLFMYDAKKATSEAIQVNLEQTGKEYRLTVKPNAEWLDSIEREYPVTVDPTVVQINLEGYDPSHWGDIDTLTLCYFLPTNGFIRANSVNDNVPDLDYSYGDYQTHEGIITVGGDFNELFHPKYILPYPVKVYYEATNHGFDTYWSAITCHFRINKLDTFSKEGTLFEPAFVDYQFKAIEDTKIGSFTLLQGEAVKFRITNSKYFRFLGVDTWTSNCTLIIRCQKESMSPLPTEIEPLTPTTQGNMVTLRWKAAEDDFNRDAWSLPNYGASIPLDPSYNGELTKKRFVVGYRVQYSTDPSFSDCNGTISDLFGPPYSPDSSGNYICTIRGLEENTTYYFRVYAIDEEGNPWDLDKNWDPFVHPSAPRWSNVVSTKMVAPSPAGVPARPEITGIDPGENPNDDGQERYYSKSGTPQIGWDQNQAADICFKKEQAPFTEYITTVNDNLSSAKINPVKDGKYIATVRTFNSAGKSKWSKPWKVTIDTTAPSLSKKIIETVKDGHVTLQFTSTEDVKIDIYWNNAYLRGTVGYQTYDGSFTDDEDPFDNNYKVTNGGLELDNLNLDESKPNYYRLEVCDRAGNTYSTGNIQLGGNIPNPGQNFGLESYWNYQSISLGRAGTAQINTDNGNLIISAADFSIPGQGLPLAMSRYYNSYSDYRGMLGRNWRSSYEAYVQVSGSDLIISDPDGSSHTFTGDGVGGYTPLKGDHRRVVHNQAGSYTVFETNGTRYKFNTVLDGKYLLNAISDRFGNTLQLTYDQNGYLTTAREPSGRITANFKYDYYDPAGGKNLLSQIDLIPAKQGQAARKIFFLYQSGNLAEVRFPSDKAVNGINVETAVVYGYDSASNLLDSSKVCEVAGPQEQKGSRKNDTTFVYKPMKHSIGEVATYFTQNSQPVPVNYRFTYYEGTTRVTDPRGTIAVYVHYGVDSPNNGQCRSVTYKTTDGKLLQGPITYTYDPDYHLTTMTSSKEVFDIGTGSDIVRNIVTTYNYDTNGNLEKLIVDDGTGSDNKRLTTQIKYQAENNWVLTDIKEIIDPKGKSMIYDNTYENGKLTKMMITPPATTDKYTITHTFNEFGERIDKEVVSKLARYDFKYGYQDGLLSSLTNQAGTTEYYYTPYGERNGMKDANNIVTKYTIQQDTGMLKAVHIPEKMASGNPYFNDFDDYTVNGAPSGGDIIRFSYDYDVNGNKVAEIDYNKMVNHYDYNELNLLSAGAKADSTSTSLYDAGGNLIYVYNSNNNGLAYAYDGLNRRIQTRTCCGQALADVIQEELQYDSAGRVKVRWDAYKVANGRGGRTIYYYDSTDNLMKTERIGKNGINLTTLYYKLDAGNIISYDNNGNLLTKTAPISDKADNGLITTDYEYDTLNRLTAIRVSSAKDSGKYDQTIGYKYDAGQLKKMTIQIDGQAEKTYTYKYDACMRLESIINPGGQMFKFDYYPGGQRRHKYIYDQYNQFSDPAAFITLNYRYDEAYLLRQLDYHWGADYYLTMDYEYGIFNGVDKITKNPIKYNLNAPGPAQYLISQLQGDPYANIPGEEEVNGHYHSKFANKYTYDNLGRMTSSEVYGINPHLTAGNNGNNGSSYTSPGICMRHQSVSNTNIDANGNPHDKRTISTGGRGTVTEEHYNYNYLNQMTGMNTAVYSSSSYNYQVNMDFYDDEGNRFREEYVPYSPIPSPNPQIRSEYQYGLDNQLLWSKSHSWYNVVPKYDPGNESADEHGYISASSGTTTENWNTYELDGKLLKVKSHISDTTNVYIPFTAHYIDYYYYSHDGVVTQRQEDEDNPNQVNYNYYTRLGGELLSCDNNGAPYFYIQNIRGDVMLLVNPNGSVKSVRDYDASGQMLCKAPQYDRDPFGFTGGIDAGNGLWKLGARFYDSGKNSFIQQDRYMGDPSDPLSLNRYVYCGLDPVNYVDPTGFTKFVVYGLFTPNALVFGSSDGASGSIGASYNGASIGYSSTEGDSFSLNGQFKSDGAFRVKVTVDDEGNTTKEVIDWVNGRQANTIINLMENRDFVEKNGTEKTVTRHFLGLFSYKENYYQYTFKNGTTGRYYPDTNSYYQYDANGKLLSKLSEDLSVTEWDKNGEKVTW